MADRMSLFSVPQYVTRLVPFAVLAAGFAAPLPGFAQERAVQREVQRRLDVAQEASSLEAEGDAAVVEGKLGEAVGHYSAALDRLPAGAGALQAQRRNLVAKFASASVNYADQQAKKGQIDAATLTLNAVLDDRAAPGYKPALTLRKQLQDPDRYNPALTPAHVENTDKVRRLFTLATGFEDLADWTAARGAYNQILAADATNIAARRGLERVEMRVNDYLRAARDHTHAKMINDVDRQWEAPVTAVRSGLSQVPGPSGDGDVASGYAPAQRKLQTIIIDSLSMSETPLRDALVYLVRKSRELDVTEPDPEARGVNIIFNPGSRPEDSFPTVSVDLRGISLGEALKQIGDLTNTRTFTVGNSVMVAPVGENSRIVLRRFRVAPGFLTKVGTSEVDAAAGQDPFGGGAEGDEPGKGLKITRVSAQDWLARNGVSFPEGSRADYIPSSNTLMVRNTEENLALVDNVLEATMDKSQQQVLVTVILLKTEQRNLEELGYDWLVAPANLGDSGLFFGGGTVGNASGNGAGLAENYPLVSPNGAAVGGSPMTAGLRGASDLFSNPGIDDLIASGTTGPGTGTGTGGSRSPGILAVSGVFTDPQVTAIMRGLNQKKGIDLSSSTSLILKSGQRGTAGSTRLIPYPTEFDPPQIPQTITGQQVLFDDGSVADLPETGVPPVTPTTPQSFEFKDTGTTLEVEATVGEDGRVQLDLNAVFREFDGFINYGTPITSGSILLTSNQIFQPVFSVVSASVSPTVADGATITIAGLSEGKWATIQDKVPLLGDLPFVGRFFRSDVKEVTRKAVVYFVKVKIIDPGGVSRQEAAGLAEKSGELPGP